MNTPTQKSVHRVISATLALAMLLPMPMSYAVDPPLTRAQMDVLANQTISSIRDWSELQLMHQFAKLTKDWEVSFRQLTGELNSIQVRTGQAADDLAHLESTSASAVRLDAVMLAGYRISVLKSEAEALEENIVRTRQAWTNRCSTDRLNSAVGSTLSRALQMFEPFRINMSGAVASFSLCGTVGATATATSNGSSISTTVAPMSGSSGSDTLAYCGAAGTLASIGGWAGGAALASAAGATSGLVIGAAAGGVGILAAAAAVAIVSAIDFAQYASMMGRFYRDYEEVRAAVNRAWAGLQGRLTAQAPERCQEWLGAIAADEADPAFTVLATQAQTTRATIEALSARKSQVMAGLRDEFANYLRSLPALMMRWQMSHLAYLRTLLAQLRHDDVESRPYISNQVQPAWAAVMMERRTAQGSAILLMQAENRLWDLMINGDIAFRKQTGWSFPATLAADPDTYGLRSGWDAWIENTRGTIR